MGRRSRSIAVMALLAVCLALAPAGRTQPAGGGGLGPALAALERGDYADAERRLAAITSGVDAVAARVAQARVELRTGRYARAAETAAAAAALSKEAKIAAAPVRAEALAATGKTAEAIAVAREVADEPRAHRARVALGELLIRTGQRADAVAVLKQLFEAYQDDTIKGTDAEGLALVARAAHLMRKPKNANKIFDEAEAAGARVETLLWRADLHLEKYDPATAGQLVKAAEKLAPGDARVALARARVGLAMVAGAAFELESATLTLPRSGGDPLYAAAMYDQLAAVYDTLKKKAKAKKVMRSLRTTLRATIATGGSPRSPWPRANRPARDQSDVSRITALASTARSD